MSRESWQRQGIKNRLMALEDAALATPAPLDGLDVEERLLTAIFGRQSIHVMNVSLDAHPCAGCRWWTRYEKGLLYEDNDDPTARLAATREGEG